MTAKKRKRKCRWVWDDKYAEFKTACKNVLPCFYNAYKGRFEGCACRFCGKPIEVVK